MKLKRAIATLLATCFCLTWFVACNSTQSTNSNNDSTHKQEETFVRDVTDYGVEVFEPFDLPVKPKSAESITLKDSNGETVEIEVDKQNRITVTMVGDYTLTIETETGVKTYSLYVRDTQAPVFGSVTQVSSCLVGDTFDLNALHVAVDNYSEVKITHKVYHMAATEIPVSQNAFYADKAGYYIVVTKAEDTSGNYWTYRSKVWCGNLKDNEINTFDDMFLKEASTGIFSDEIRMGDKGYSLKISVSGESSGASCSHPRDLSEVTEIYYYAYVDSTSWRNANATDGVGELPEKPKQVAIPVLAGWKRVILGELAWDTWIPVLAQRDSENKAIKGNTIGFSVNNQQLPWGLTPTDSTDPYGSASGYSYDIYVDNLRFDNPITSEVDENTVQDFDNMAFGAISYKSGGTGGNTTKFVKQGLGSAYVVGNDHIDTHVDIKLYKDISQIDTLYYWIYFDSESFTSSDSSYSRTNLPEITNQVISRHRFDAWSQVALTEKTWDTWILIKATKNSGNTESLNIDFKYCNYDNTWGTGNAWSISPFRYTLYIDSITMHNPLES